MNKKMLMLAATLIAGAVPLAGQAQTTAPRTQPSGQTPPASAPVQVIQPGQLLSRTPQSQGGTAPNSAVVSPNLPAGLVPAPGRDPAPQLSTGGGSQPQQPGQTTTR